jgi:hypothetical protein
MMCHNPDTLASLAAIAGGTGECGGETTATSRKQTDDEAGQAATNDVGGSLLGGR